MSRIRDAVLVVYIIVGALYLGAWLIFLRHNEPPEE